MTEANEITATEAARRLGITDKTLRKWIANGRISARHVTATRLALKAEDVSELASELDNAKASDINGVLSAISTRLTEIEYRLATLETVAQVQIEALEKRVIDLEALTTRRSPHQATLFEVTPREPRHDGRSSPAPAIDLPDGAILATIFAKRHNVNRRTFGDHMTVGLGRGEVKEKVAHEAVKNPSRPSETIRYLTPDQQEAALAYWRRWQVQFDLPGQDENV